MANPQTLTFENWRILQMEVSINIILQEIQIRIDKLRQFEMETERKRAVKLHRTTKIRRKEYESFKNWIEAQMTNDPNIEQIGSKFVL
jgi:hypothetical protein